VRYVPEAFGNRNDANPVAVTYRVPTEGDRREIEYAGPVTFTDGQAMLDALDVIKRHHAACRRCVVSVENYSDADGKPIDNGDRLARHGETDIVLEVGAQILLRAEPTDEERKKSEGSPG